jgi:hypothetical protein
MWDPWLQERVPFAKDGAFEMARWLGAERLCPKGEAFEMATGKFEGGTDFCGTCPQKVSGGKLFNKRGTSFRMLKHLSTRDLSKLFKLVQVMG